MCHQSISSFLPSSVWPSNDCPHLALLSGKEQSPLALDFLCPNSFCLHQNSLSEIPQLILVVVPGVNSYTQYSANKSQIKKYFIQTKTIAIVTMPSIFYNSFIVTRADTASGPQATTERKCLQSHSGKY